MKYRNDPLPKKPVKHAFSPISEAVSGTREKPGGGGGGLKRSPSHSLALHLTSN